MFLQLNNRDVLIIFFFGVYVLLFLQSCELPTVLVSSVLEKVLNEPIHPFMFSFYSCCFIFNKYLVNYLLTYPFWDSVYYTILASVLRSFFSVVRQIGKCESHFSMLCRFVSQKSERCSRLFHTTDCFEINSWIKNYM